MKRLEISCNELENLLCVFLKAKGSGKGSGERHYEHSPLFEKRAALLLYRDFVDLYLETLSNEQKKRNAPQIMETFFVEKINEMNETHTNSSAQYPINFQNFCFELDLTSGNNEYNGVATVTPVRFHQVRTLISFFLSKYFNYSVLFNASETHDFLQEYRKEYIHNATANPQIATIEYAADSMKLCHKEAFHGYLTKYNQTNRPSEDDPAANQKSTDFYNFLLRVYRSIYQE